jgi:hypothetical protein
MESWKMETSMAEAQADMRRGYYSGAAGVLASALAWSAAAGTAALGSPERAIWVLLVGGMLIHPVGVLICRLLGASGAHSKSNPLGSLAAASTFWLIFSLPLAYGLGLLKPEWFFSAMLLIIGGRFLVFATVYGMRLYWALGLSLAGAGFASHWLGLPAPAVAFAGAVIEGSFAFVGMLQHRHWVRPNNSSKPTPLRGAA